MSEIVAKITNLSHKYKDVIALEDINLELPKGKMIGLIGPLFWQFYLEQKLFKKEELKF